MVAILTTTKQNKAIFFDRDGTLNVEVNYLHEIEKFIWTLQAPEAIFFAKNLGYKILVITNQSGVARGYFPENDVKRLHQFMNDDLEKKFGQKNLIDGFYYCPHLPKEDGGKIFPYAISCDCRKPKTKLLEQACQDFSIDKNKSLLIGDSQRDLECARRAGIRSVLYSSDMSLLTLVQKNIEGENHC